jgi:hypothetical protein
MAFLKYVGPEPEVLDPFLGTFTRGIAKEVEDESARVKVQGNSAVWQILQPAAATPAAESAVDNKMMDYGKKKSGRR